ncbi:hypothetical protein P7410_26510 [Vibrio parahaemolyticus]|nr:hypothetical protein [Vibrio parahaemolyticus]
MNDSIYYHVEHKTLKVIEALMKGHIVTLAGETFRYLREGQQTSTLEALRTGFFINANKDDEPHWIFYTESLGFLEAQIKKASTEEVEAIIANLSLDSVHRENNILRHISMVKNRLDKDQGRHFLVRAFNSEEYQRTESVLMNRLYDYLQKDNSFPLDRNKFYVLENKQVNEIISMLFDTLDKMTHEGVILTKSVFGDACSYARLANLITEK